MMFHPEYPVYYKSSYPAIARLSDRIFFLNGFEASEENTSKPTIGVKQELKDEGVALYKDEAEYLDDYYLGRSETSEEDIKDIYDYIEKLKSIDSDFAAFVEKETILASYYGGIYARRDSQCYKCRTAHCTS